MCCFASTSTPSLRACSRRSRPRTESRASGRAAPTFPRRTETFPPHWVGTTVRWDVDARDGGSTVAFRHAGFDDEEEAGRVAYTWGQIMTRLKEYAETGRPDPVFA